MSTIVINRAKDTVVSFINALNDLDYEKARSYVKDDLSFVGVLGTRQGADAYFKDMERMQFKYDIVKVFTDDNDVCLFYNINMQGKTIFCSGWYRIEEGKIKSFQVVFDPRPLLS